VLERLLRIEGTYCRVLKENCVMATQPNNIVEEKYARWTSLCRSCSLVSDVGALRDQVGSKNEPVLPCNRYR